MKISNRCPGSGMYTSYGNRLQHVGAVGVCPGNDALAIVLSEGRELSIYPIVSKRTVTLRLIRQSVNPSVNILSSTSDILSNSIARPNLKNLLPYPYTSAKKMPL